MHSRHLLKLGALFSFISLTMLYINNAYLLYEHSCHAHKLSAMDLLGFRLVLARARKVARDAAQSARVSELDRVSNIVDLKRGRCHYCQIKKKKPQHYTSFVCRVCRV